MTINGTISASAVLLAHPARRRRVRLERRDGPTTVLENGQQVETYQFPALGFVGIVIGFIAVIVAMRKPALAKILGPVYAIGYGFAVGAISKGYETFYNGIVLQAVLATASVFGVMLVLYRTRIIKVTDKFRRAVIFATLGVMVLYLGSFIFSLFGGSLPFLNGDNMAHEHRLLGVRVRPRGDEPRPRLRLHRAGDERRNAEGVRVGRRARPRGHARVALPRDPAPARRTSRN